MELQSPTNATHRFSQSSQPQMEAGMPSVQYMDLTQEAAIAQQPPSRFRPSNYTVDLNNTTNPPPPHVIVKPAVMLRRDERPEPVSFTATDAAQRTISEMGSGSGIPESTYSELAAILLSIGMEEGETGPHYEYVWLTAHLRLAYRASYPKT